MFGLSAPLAIDPQNSSILYAGSYFDIFKSTDGGRTWKSSSAGLPLTCCLIPNTLAIDPINPVNIYAALSIGLFKSTDRGANWRAVYPYTGGQQPQFQSVVLDPRSSGVLYGLSGGVYKSTDGGITWIGTNSGLPATQINSSYYPVTSLVIHPEDSNTLYAGTSPMERVAVGVARSEQKTVESPDDQRRGWLKNGNPVGNFLMARRCGAKNRKGEPCGCPRPISYRTVFLLSRFDVTLQTATWTVKAACLDRAVYCRRPHTQ